jgi:hypothetical protein
MTTLLMNSRSSVFSNKNVTGQAAPARVRRVISRHMVEMNVGKLLFTLVGISAACMSGQNASAAPKVAKCAGAALQGGARLICGHADPAQPDQFCTFSWSLSTISNETRIVNGSFSLPAGARNLTVYEGEGFARAVSAPIVMCQGRRGLP